MKKIILALFAVVLTSAGVYALGPLTNTPFGLLPNAAIQQCTPTATINKALGTGGGGGGLPLFNNFTTTGYTCIAAQGVTGTTAVPVAAAVKYRVGGFSTGHEPDYNILPAAGGNIWLGNGVNKIGFQAISSATSTTSIKGSRQ